MSLWAAVRPVVQAVAIVTVGVLSTSAHAQSDCPVDHDKLLTALKAAVKASGGPANGGFETNEWGTVVSRTGAVCAVAFTGAAADDQWPGSRLISAEKANTANGLSLKAMALSTANLYASVQPGGPLFGLELTNPVNTAVAYSGDATTFGTASDPLVGHPIGGVVVFGGGLALYDGTNVVGGVGVSGDSSCADHNIAWRVRGALGLDKAPAGVNPTRKDAIIYDIDPNGKSASGWGHPKCAGTEAQIGDDIGAAVGGATLGK